MEGVVVADVRGRVTLGSDLVEKYGRKFAVVKVPGEIVLIPIPKDPLKSLQEQGKKIPPHLTLKDLKRLAEEKAMEEAVGSYQRLQRFAKSRRRK